MYFIWITFVILAAITNSCMDTLKDHFSTSVFWKLCAAFWDASISWKNKYIGGKKENGRTYWLIWKFKITIPSFLTDAWHPAKSLMLLFLSIAIVTHVRSHLFTNIWLDGAFDICIFGFAWCLPFSLFYDKILKKKTTI